MLTHWNEWLLQQKVGHHLLQVELQCLSHLLINHFGKHALLIGVPEQSMLLKATTIPAHTILSPLLEKKLSLNYVECDLHELSILPGTIDLVLLPHTLEFVDNPRQLLSEACKIVKPEGIIVISGFNPYSAWGLKKALSKHRKVPWSGNFVPAFDIKKWLQLADFEMEVQKSLLFRPPFPHSSLYRKLQFLEKIGERCFPFFGGVYMLLARAKVIPLTPIKLQWKQQLSGIRISTTLTGPLVRKSFRVKSVL